MNVYYYSLPYPENLTPLQLLAEVAWRRSMVEEFEASDRRAVDAWKENRPPSFLPFLPPPLAHSSRYTSPPHSFLSENVSPPNHPIASLSTDTTFYYPPSQSPLNLSFTAPSPTLPTPSSSSASSHPATTSSTPPPPPAPAPPAPRPAPRRHACTMCPKSYTKKAHLQEHLLKHEGLKPHACEWRGCSRRFVRRDELVRHLRVHTGERRHKCAICGFRFQRSDHLQKHVRTKHRGRALRE